MPMENRPGAPLPFHSFVSTTGNPKWPETAVGYSTFYHRFANGSSLEDAVEAMKIASGHDEWVLESGETIRQGFIEYMASRIDLSEAQRDLGEVARRDENPPDTKAFEQPRN
jgi:hypothetical protein